MTNPTLTARITEARDHIHDAWLAARTQYPTQPPHPVTTLCAAALAQMEKACAAVQAAGQESGRHASGEHQAAGDARGRFAGDARGRFAADMDRLEKSDPVGAQWVEHILTERTTQQPEGGDRG